MKIKVVLLLAIVIAAAAAGCRQGGELDRRPVTPREKTPATEPQERVQKSVLVDDVRVEITGTKKRFGAGEIIPVQLRLTNTSSAAVTLHFANAQKYDISVTEAEGREVWRWSAGKMFAQATEELTLKPGEWFNYFEKIESGALPAGDHSVAAWSTAEELVNEQVKVGITVAK